MIPDTETSCYWSVWYDPQTKESKGTAWLMWCPFNENPSVNDSWGHAEEIDDGWIPERFKVGTAWLMWCAFGEDPSVNDSWCHAEEIDESCRNVLTAIESVYGVSFHESIYEEVTSE